MKQVKILFLIVLSSCARERADWKRNVTANDVRKYHIEQYSGGCFVHQWDFKGILNNQDSSDGFYWFIGDTLYEISGDITISSIPLVK